MIAVIFEVTPREGRYDDYLEIAGDLKPVLETMDGFISIERFQSLTTPGKVLSLSFWRDEDAIAQWRGHLGHAAAQEKGKAGIFKDFRILE